MTDRDLWKAIRNRLGGRFRSDKYRAFVVQFPCVGCGQPGRSTFHHIFGSFGPLKSADIGVPLCGSCHTKYQEDAEKNTWLLVDAVEMLVNYLEGK